MKFIDKRTNETKEAYSILISLKILKEYNLNKSNEKIYENIKMKYIILLK